MVTSVLFLTHTTPKRSTAWAGVGSMSPAKTASPITEWMFTAFLLTVPLQSNRSAGAVSRLYGGDRAVLASISSDFSTSAGQCPGATACVLISDRIWVRIPDSLFRVAVTVRTHPRLGASGRWTCGSLGR